MARIAAVDAKFAREWATVAGQRAMVARGSGEVVRVTARIAGDVDVMGLSTCGQIDMVRSISRL